MDHEIQFGGDPQDVTVTTSGLADVAGFACMNEELVSHPRFRPGMAILLDHCALDVSELTEPDVRRIAALVTGVTDRLGQSPVAMVADSFVVFSVAGLSEQFIDPRVVRTRVCASREEGLEWLSEQKRLLAEPEA
jgi:hypothetical protein